MIVGTRQGGLSISETADLLGFRCTVSRVAENGAKNKQKSYPSLLSQGFDFIFILSQANHSVHCPSAFTNIIPLYFLFFSVLFNHVVAVLKQK